MGLRFNPAPGWPPPPPGFVPPPHWQPDPSWPPAPPGWQIWVDDSAPDFGAPDFGAPDFGAATDPGAAVRPDDFGGGPGTPPWAADLTGPQTAALRGALTQPYAGASGPQQPYTNHDPSGPQDPFTRRGPGAPGRRGGPEHPPGAPGKANGFAVASFVLGVIGVTVIGAIASVVLGILALGQIRRTRQRGRGLAIGGLVLSGVWLALLGAYVTVHGSGQAQPPSAGRHSSSPTARPGASVSPGTLSTNVFSLRPGQCFQNPPASQTVLGVTYVTVVPCTTPHNAQAFVQFTATGSSYPGVAALKRQADQGCHARIKKNVQTSKIKNSMTLHYLYPLESSWASHKTITCLIVSSKPNLTASLLRANAGH